ncbi:hypothetical protein SNK05_010676 [Fusarium graminearum]
MSDPVHPFSLTNGTGDIRFTLPGSNQEWTTRIQRPGEEQVNNNPSNNTPMERQASRRPQHDMLPQQHGQFVQQPQHGRRPSSTRGIITMAIVIDTAMVINTVMDITIITTMIILVLMMSIITIMITMITMITMIAMIVMVTVITVKAITNSMLHLSHMPPGRQMAPPGYGIARVPAPQGSGRAPLGHQMAFTEHLRRGQEMTPLGVPRHVIDNADSEMMESLLGTPRRPKWESTMAADMEALGLNTPERQRRGQEMTPLGVPRHVIDNADSETIQSLLGTPRRPKWKSTMAVDIEELNRLRRNR